MTIEVFFGSLVVLYFSKAASSVSALHSTHSLTNKPARHSSSAAVGLNSCPSYFMPSPATRRLLHCSQHRTITKGPSQGPQSTRTQAQYPTQVQAPAVARLHLAPSLHTAWFRSLDTIQLKYFFKTPVHHLYLFHRTSLKLRWMNILHFT